MNKIILIIATIFFAGIAQASEINFSWNPNTDSTEGYVLVMDSGSNEIAVIEGKESSYYSYLLEDDRRCHSFALYAYNSESKSDLSNFVKWCPKSIILQIPINLLILK